MIIQTKGFTIKLLNDLYEDGFLNIPPGYLEPAYSAGTVEKLKLGMAQDIIYAIEDESGSIEIISNRVITPLLNYYRTSFAEDNLDKRQFGRTMVNICLLDPRSAADAETFRNLATL